MTCKSLTEIALTLMEGLDCARSLQVAILVRHNEWDQLVELRFDPSLYTSPDDAWRANAATEFLRKCEGLPTSYDLREEAKKKFWASEKQCFDTNQRLLPLKFGRNDLFYEGALHDFVDGVKRRILSVIGAKPPSHYEGGFGPGATVSDDARHSTVPDKMSSVPTMTRDAVFHLVPWSGTEWGKAAAKLGNVPTVVRGNSFFSVPKDATTHRGCCKEPSINAFYQKALGQVLRTRLMASGIDLTRGKELHMALARESSFDNSLCTIDLSSASDTVSRSLVQLLLPDRWFEVLNDLRSPFTVIDNKTVWLEKFSSMGNGYTFELETLLFAAIVAEAVGKDALLGSNVFVFGDDIICPTESSTRVLAALRFFGFTPNKRKTYVEGCFRESCGGDYYLGTNVRAHYLEKEPHEPQHYISLANGIRRMARNVADFDTRWRRLRRAWHLCLDSVPSDVRRCRGPEELGDLVFTDEEQRWQIRWRQRRSMRFVRVYRPVSTHKVRWEGFAYDVQFATALYLVSRKPNLGREIFDMSGSFPPWGRVEPALSLDYSSLSRGDRDRRGNLAMRDSIDGYKVGWVPFS